MLNVDDVKVMNLQIYSNYYNQTSVCKELSNSFLHASSFTLQASGVEVEDIGVEPMTPCVQGRCSDQLS
jgi:hypothetical protein